MKLEMRLEKVGWRQIVDAFECQTVGFLMGVIESFDHRNNRF